MRGCGLRRKVWIKSVCPLELKFMKFVANERWVVCDWHCSCAV